jgi:hypothetical protein
VSIACPKNVTLCDKLIQSLLHGNLDAARAIQRLAAGHGASSGGAIRSPAARQVGNVLDLALITTEDEEIDVIHAGRDAAAAACRRQAQHVRRVQGEGIVVVPILPRSIASRFVHSDGIEQKRSIAGKLHRVPIGTAV